jgi:UDP-N-acetylglucosamine acyltransferase
MVRKDVPPFITAAGDPLTYSGVNSVGLKRRGFSNDDIKLIQDIFRTLYQSGKNISQAVEVVKKDIPASPHRSMVLDFIANSSRGLIRK